MTVICQRCSPEGRGAGGPRPRPPHPAPVKGPEGAAQAGQSRLLSGLYVAVQEVTDLVPLVGRQVSRTAQTEGKLPELHQHPRVPRRTCQRACHAQASGRQAGLRPSRAGGRAHLSRALAPTAAGGEPAPQRPASSPRSRPAAARRTRRNSFPQLCSAVAAGPDT